jgi:hypothetical protein
MDVLDTGATSADVRKALSFRHVAIVSTAEPGGLASSVKWGLEQTGRQATLIPYTDWVPNISYPALRGVGALSRAIGAIGRPGAERKLVATVAKLKPDLTLLVKCDDLHQSTYRAIKRAAPAPLVAFHPDDPWNRGLFMLLGVSHRRALLQIRAVDVHFLWSRKLVEKARQMGANSARYMPLAYDPTLHPRAQTLSNEDRRRYGADVAFIGNWDGEREKWLAPLTDAGVNLAIWGSIYWSRRCGHSGLRRAFRGRPLQGAEQAIAVAATPINLNILRCQNKGACNMRTFEIPGMGGFMLHERSPEAAQYFPPGIACGDFGSPAELVSAVQYWLAHPEERMRVAEEGYRRAMAWTYREWSARLIDHVTSALSDSSQPL